MRVNRAADAPETAAIPDSLAGKRVLDIGAWDGWFSFELEKRGAEVMAVDCWRNERLLEMKEMLGSRVDYRVIDIYDLSPKGLGTFDVVLCLGVLYHLKHPLLGLERVCAVTRDMAVIESFMIEGDDRPVAEFYETDEFGGQTDNWSGPNVPCLLAWCRTAGFARVEHVATHEHGAVVVCKRRFEPPSSDGPAVLLGTAVHNWNFGLNFRSDRDDYVWASASIEPVCTVTRETVKPEVAGYGVVPLAVTQDAGSVQVNFKLPPGLRAGWHDVTVRVADGPASNARQIAVDVPPLADAIVITGLCDGTTWQPGSLDRSHGDIVSLWVTGLPDNADIANTNVLINGVRARLTYVEERSDAPRQLNCSIPQQIGNGRTGVKIVSGGVESREVPLVVVGTTMPGCEH